MSVGRSSVIHHPFKKEFELGRLIFTNGVDGSCLLAIGRIQCPRRLWRNEDNRMPEHNAENSLSELRRKEIFLALVNAGPRNVCGAIAQVHHRTLRHYRKSGAAHRARGGRQRLATAQSLNAVRAKMRLRHSLQNYPWAYEMKVDDPDGHVLRFGSESRSDRPFDQ